MCDFEAVLGVVLVVHDEELEDSALSFIVRIEDANDTLGRGFVTLLSRFS